MVAVFLATFSLVCGILVIYPYSIYPMGVLLLGRLCGALGRTVDPAEASAPLHIDIVLCAYNEESCITDKIENCLALMTRYAIISVHVYSDGSNDRTEEILRQYDNRIDVVISRSRNGKSTGINCLLDRCKGDIVVFTDANVKLDIDSFANIAIHFRDPEIGCIVGKLQYVNHEEGEVASVGARYWDFEQELKLIESISGSAVGADGSLFAIRRSLFRKIPADIIDDTFTSLSILCDGWRVIQVRDVVAYERSATQSSEEFNRKIRIACRNFNCHRLLWPRLRQLPVLTKFKYLSHKFLRWFGGLWFVLGISSGTAFLMAIDKPFAALAVVTGLIVIFFSHRLGLPKIGMVREILLSLIGASLGVYFSMRGTRFQTWTIAASTREWKF